SSAWPAELLSVGVGDKALGGFANALLVARPLATDRRFGDRIVVASDGLEASYALVGLAGRLAGPNGSNVTLVHALGREPIRRGRLREQERTLQEQERTLTRARPARTSELLIKTGRAAPGNASARFGGHPSMIGCSSVMKNEERSKSMNFA